MLAMTSAPITPKKSAPGAVHGRHGGRSGGTGGSTCAAMLTPETLGRQVKQTFKVVDDGDALRRRGAVADHEDRRHARGARPRDVLVELVAGVQRVVRRGADEIERARE